MQHIDLKKERLRAMDNHGAEFDTVKPLLKKIYRCAAVMTTVCWCVTLIWGFQLKDLLGFAVGYGYMCLCMWYLGRTCERAVELSADKAKKSMLSCYVVRYAGLFVLCAAAMLTGLLGAVGVLLPQFFPRLILCALQASERRDRSND